MLIASNSDSTNVNNDHSNNKNINNYYNNIRSSNNSNSADTVRLSVLNST